MKRPSIFSQTSLSHVPPGKARRLSLARPPEASGEAETLLVILFQAW